MADLGWVIIYSLLAISWLAIWVRTLIHEARREKYWWLGVTALVQLTLIVYWIVFAVSPNFRKSEKKSEESYY